MSGNISTLIRINSVGNAINASNFEKGGKMAKKCNIPGCYPFSELGGYIRHGKNSGNYKEKGVYFPDDGRFDVNCRLAKREIKMSEARILYENATGYEKEEVCSRSSSCGLKCYPN